MAQGTVTRRVNLYINGKEVGNDIKSVKAAMQKLVNEQARMTIGSKEYVAHAQKIRQLKGILDEHNAQLRTVKNNWLSLGNVADKFNKYGGILVSTIASVTGVLLGFKKLAQEVAHMDDVYSDVMKTTGMTRDEVVQLNEEFKKMDTRTSREELNLLARDAGKLGITGKKNILDFVEAGNQIRVALGEDLGDDAIKNIGKIVDLFKKSQSDLQQLDLKGQMLAIGSAINQLGQTSTASEPYLVAFAGRMGGIAAQAGISIQNVLGFASALDQNMQMVEMSATALSNFIMKIYEDPAKFAKIAGKDVKEFTTLVSEDANAAIKQVLTALSEKGGFQQLVPVFQEMGLDGTRATQVLSTLAGNIDKVNSAQEVANDAFAKGSAATNEYNVKNNNLQADLEKARNAFKDQASALGERLGPALVKSTNGFTYLVKALVQAPAFIERNKGLIIALGAALIALSGKMIMVQAALLKNKIAWLQEEVAKKKNALTTAYMNTYMEQYNKTQGKLMPGMLKLRTGFVMLNRAMMANPIGAVVLAFTALRAAITFYDRNNSESLRLEREKKEALDALSATVGKLNGEYEKNKETLSTLNRLSVEEKQNLREKIDLTIAQTEAELALYRAKQLEIKKENTKVGAWDTVWITVKTNWNPFEGSVKKMQNLATEYGNAAIENGKKAAEELNPELQKLEEVLAGLKDQGAGLSAILDAEKIADDIGTKSITELQEKVNLYRTALENTKIGTEEYIRVQNKLTEAQKQLNKAIADNNAPGEDPKEVAKKEKAALKEAERLAKEKERVEADLAKKLKEIRNDLAKADLPAEDAEILATQQKYDELLAICRKYGLDASQVMELHYAELMQLMEKYQDKQVLASIEADEKIQEALMSNSEKQKAQIREKYGELIRLAEEHGMDTAALKAKMDEELGKVKPDEEERDIFGMTPEKWKKLMEDIQEACDMAGQLADIWGAFNQIQTNSEKRELAEYEKSCNKKKELLNRQLSAGRISQEQYNAKVKQMDDELENKKKEQAKKQAKRDKAQAIFSTVINTASAIVQALNGPWPASLIFAALAGAMGAAQIGVISSTPPPEFAKGGMTDGARLYVAGEKGREWISPNWMLEDPVTGPMIQRLELIRSGILSPDQLQPAVPDFTTMTSIPLYAGGGFTGMGNNMYQYNYTTSDTSAVSDPAMEAMANDMRLLREFLSDPTNRQAYISHDLQTKNDKKIATLDRLRRF